MYQIGWLCAILFLLCGIVQARQLDFSRQYLGNQLILSYKWQDRERLRHGLSFKLPIDDAGRGNNEFQAFDHAAASRAAYSAVKRYADAHPKLEVSATFGQNAAYRYVIKDNNPATYAKYEADLKSLYEDAYDNDVLRQFYTTFNNYVMPDHKRIAKRYVQAMRPVAQAIAQATRGWNRREVLNFTLNFLQNIPYDQLNSRATSNGAGFQTPYGLLINNKGDCDTKAVAMAAILRNLYPTQRIVIVYVPNHAFLGLHGMPAKGDKILRLGQSREPFVLIDPTGPGLALVGEVQNQANRYIAKNDYSYQEIPF